MNKAFLYGLRVISFLLLLLILFKPELEFNKSRIQKNSIAVLLDDSKSLAIKTFPEEKPRFDIVRRVLKKNRDYFENLKKDFQVDFYFASDRITAVPGSDIESRYRVQGLNTDLNQVLREVKKHYEGKALQGVMLFSDGADLGEDLAEVSEEMADTLSFFEAPIHTFQAGSNENFKDLGIEKLEGADFGFVRQEVNLSVSLIASSMGNKNIPLVLKEGDKVLVSKVIEIKEGQSRYKTDLQFVPNTTGKKVYTLSVPLFVGESIESNNRKEFQVKVIRDRIRVLLLNGRPSWDARFLREVLINNPKVDLLSFFILRSFSDDVQASVSELSLISFPSNLLLSDYLGSFDLVIFQNFRYKPFIQKQYLENIEKYVRHGGAFIMIGGDLSFQGGGYYQTGVDNILPVRIRSKTSQFLNDAFKPRIGKQFAHHPILRLEKSEELNHEAWSSMPELRGLNIGLEPAKDAQVLIRYTKTGDHGDAYPVLAVRKNGDGRSLILATDSSWAWNFLRVGQGGSGRYYQNFWNNVVAWMTNEPETQQIKIETDKERYRENEKVLIKVKMLREDYNPLPNEKIDLILHSISNGKTLSKHTLQTNALGEANFEFTPSGEGFYSARLKRAAEDLKKEALFSVFSETAEFEKPLINSLLLKTMAEATGGAFRVLDEQTNLADQRFSNPEVRTKSDSKILSLWDNWWVYFMFIGFLSMEWWTRRKLGLS
ncbi:MAG: glutamine amidotransferase [Nitrospinales bacterium]